MKSIAVLIFCLFFSIWSSNAEDSNEKKSVERVNKLIRQLEKIEKKSDDDGVYDSYKASQAVNALSDLGDSAIPTIHSIFKESTRDGRIRAYTLQALSQLSYSDLTADLLSALTDKSGWVRIEAADALRRRKLDPNMAIPALVLALKDENDSVCMSAASALGAYGALATEGVPPLISLLDREEPRVFVRGAALQAIAKIGGPESRTGLPKVIALLDSTDSQLQSVALQTISTIGGPETQLSIPKIIELLKDNRESTVRSAASDALGKIGVGNLDALTALIRALQAAQKRGGEARNETLSIIGAIANFGSTAKDSIPVLISMLDDTSQYSVAIALGRIGPACIPALSDLIKNNRTTARQFAFEALGQIGADAINVLLPLLADDDWNTRVSAARVLGQIGPKAEKAIPALTKLLQEKPPSSFVDIDGRSERTIRHALHKISPERFPYKTFGDF
jgi:HEAT repeat protein